MIYLTDDLSFALSLTGGLPLLQSYPTDATQVKNLLQTNDWRSCVTSKFAEGKLKEILKCDVALYKKDLFRIKEEDLIIYFRTELWFRDDEVLTKKQIQQLLFKFSAVKIVDVVGIDDTAKYLN